MLTIPGRKLHDGSSAMASAHAAALAHAAVIPVHHVMPPKKEVEVVIPEMVKPIKYVCGWIFADVPGNGAQQDRHCCCPADSQCCCPKGSKNRQAAACWAPSCPFDMLKLVIQLTK
jgi:hypothetical protein